jgi:hypothetical protein
MIQPSKTYFRNRWLAWTCDAIDFFNVALSVTNLQAQFHQAEASSIVSHDIISFPTTSEALTTSDHGHNFDPLSPFNRCCEYFFPHIP